MKSPQVSAVHVFAQQADGSRIRTFHVSGIDVQVRGDREHDDAAEALASSLQAAAQDAVRGWKALEERCAAAEARASELESEAIRLRALVPPPAPVRVLGPCCVRFWDGGLYLLNRRERGWASWGVRCAGWDDLFRRYAVVITEHGTDEHGAYWVAAPEPTP